MRLAGLARDRAAADVVLSGASTVMEDAHLMGQPKLPVGHRQ